MDDVGALIWFIGALILAGLELLVGEFTLLMLGFAAAIAGGVALFGAPLWVEVAAFAVSALSLLVFLRPVFRRLTDKPAALDTSPNALVGSSAEVIEPFSGGKQGQIRLDGSIWSAKSLDPQVGFSEGDLVHVIKIDGATAIVWKTD